MATTADILGSHRNGKAPARWSKHYERLCAERDRLLARDGSAPECSLAKLDDLAEAASDESQRCLSLLEASATQASIVEVLEAIRRIERGIYGRCELTGEPIEAERLRAIPWTRFSLAGQTEMEKYGWVRRHALPPIELFSEPALADAEESEMEAPIKNGNGSGDQSE
jgi:RNA polymerase-binding transcription factor DksA